jgi:hypothetical protein
MYLMELIIKLRDWNVGAIVQYCEIVRWAGLWAEISGLPCLEA